MDIHEDVLLKDYTTMRLGGPAKYMIDVASVDELSHIIIQAKSQNTPVFILGSGSNTIVHDEGFAGYVVRVRIPGFEVIADDTMSTTIRVGAGENWDTTVRQSVERNLTGIEALSLIPGTTGAGPVQNIGAYGQEISDTLMSVEAYDIPNNTVVTLTNEQCKFSYRDSIFRSSDKGRYVIVSVTLRLLKSAPTPPFYDALQKYLDTQNITIYTPQVIRDAIIAIRTDKLPDPKMLPNSGSFFKNAIVETWKSDELHAKYPDMPAYDMGDNQTKIPTGWLIEQAGFKGTVLHGIKVHDKNSLVLINQSATSYVELSRARDEIITKVSDMFGITIEQEPLEI